MQPADQRANMPQPQQRPSRQPPDSPREPLLPYNGLALDRATSDAIAVDHDELVEARWFTRAGLALYRAARPRTHGDSIGTHLLDAWLAAGD